ncbi:nicastrin [Notothenia coriiceps]|uniref:Nicastrin n=1 Tax=Notothenia coriiceps TaxID=8208 RepID=A0A6I9PLZ6_9TELE|nr:PREDICTED: nicastrin [Notothenia coriiceps]
MDLLSNKWIVNLLVSWFFIGVGCNSVEKKIYVHLNYTIPCVRLLNATHQIGCQSSLSGNVGVLHVLESEENVDWVLGTGANPPYLVILESALFTRSIMMKLKNGSGRVAGVAVIMPNTNPLEGFSPHTSCPNENTGVYSETYDPSLAHCNVTVWNPFGNGLSYEEFDFPIFSMKDDNDTRVIRQTHKLSTCGLGVAQQASQRSRPSWFQYLLRQHDRASTSNDLTMGNFVTKKMYLIPYHVVQGAAPALKQQLRREVLRSLHRGLSKLLFPGLRPEGSHFLVASPDLEMMTLGVGIGVLMASLLLTYIMSSKADILFSSGREPANATY